MAKVEAIVLSLAPDDEDDSVDEEPRELWRQAKVVQYGKKLATGGSCGKDDDDANGCDENQRQLEMLKAKVRPFVKSRAARRANASNNNKASNWNNNSKHHHQASESNSKGGRKNHNGNSKQDSRNKNGARMRGSDSSSPAELSSDEDDNKQTNSSRNYGMSSSSSTPSTSDNDEDRDNNKYTSSPMNNRSTMNNTKKKKNRGYRTKPKFRSRYGNTLRSEDAVSPGFKQMRRTARVLHGAVRFNIASPEATGVNNKGRVDMAGDPRTATANGQQTSVDQERVTSLIQQKMANKFFKKNDTAGTTSRPKSARRAPPSSARATTKIDSKSMVKVAPTPEFPAAPKKTGADENITNYFPTGARRQMNKAKEPEPKIKKSTQDESTQEAKVSRQKGRDPQDNMVVNRDKKITPKPVLPPKLKARLGGSVSRSSSTDSRPSPKRTPVKSGPRDRLLGRRGSSQQEFKSFHASLKIQSQKSPTPSNNADYGSMRDSPSIRPSQSPSQQQNQQQQQQQQQSQQHVEQAGNNNDPDQLRLRRRSSSIGRSLNAMATQVARKARRRHSKEELYTDKDRAAAVAMGSRDIKQSLFKQKALIPAYHAGIPEEVGFTVCYTQGEHNLKNGDSKLALKFLDKALSIDPNNCNCLIARSKCHLQLGDHTAALKDAEAALRIDQHSYKAIYQKAEALYARGDFELALVFYCRGAQARKELDCFRLGVQKAQEAISNVVGQPHCLQIDAADIAKIPEVARQFACHGEVESLENQMLTTSVMTKNKNRRANKAGNKVLLDRHGGNKDRKDDELNQASKAAGALGSHKLLGKLQSDMEYLQNLLHHPGLQPITIPTMIGIPGAAGATPTAANSTNDKNKMVSSQVKEALGYLKSRQEFWQQQKPIRRSRK